MSGHSWRDGAHGRRQRIAGGRVAALLLGLALLAGMAACGGGGGGDGGGDQTAGNGSTVYGATPIEPGSECPYGGVRIDYGIDENGNGVLDPAEVDGSSAVCNGAGAQGNPVTPPASPAAQFTLAMNGGTAAAGWGGGGGSLNLNLSPSGGAGHILLFRTGVADASFMFPAVSAYLGNVPLVVPAETQLTVTTYAAAHGAIGANEVHTHASNTGIYVANGTGTADLGYTLSGIHIGVGATLTFALNYTSYANIAVPYDVLNEGTLTAAKYLNPETSGGLTLSCEVFVGTANSQILLAGLPRSDGSGGNGGFLNLTATSSLWNLDYPTGAIYNRGKIDASGADGTTLNAGSGSSVSIWGTLAVYNTGLIDTSGGNSASAGGGYGGNIRLDGYSGGTRYGSVFNSGNLDMHGGNGGTWGGSGGDLDILAHGDVRNSGDILFHGGTGGTSDGGYGGCGECTSNIEAYGGSVINSGDILAYGGDSAASWAGSGSWLQINTRKTTSALMPNLPAGDIILSGNIDFSGGDGTDGGSGGGIDLSIDAGDAPFGQEIRLLGYQSINLDAGNGTTGVSSAGQFSAYSGLSQPAPGVSGPAGGIHNHVPISAVGGSYPGGIGSSGGLVQLRVENTSPHLGNWQVAVNHANLTLSGGGGLSGGSSGAVWIEGPFGAENRGIITVNGGDGGNNGGDPGNVGGVTGVHLRASLGPAVNTGSIYAQGGAATSQTSGAAGNFVEMIGALVTHSGLITVKGGDVAPGDSSGGTGGTVFLDSLFGTSAVTGSINASPGDGASGDSGLVFIDGINRSADYLP